MTSTAHHPTRVGLFLLAAVMVCLLVIGIVMLSTGNGWGLYIAIVGFWGAAYFIDGMRER